MEGYHASMPRELRTHLINHGKGDQMAEAHQADHVSRLAEDIKALVRGANVAHLATLMRDGSPQVDPVWVDLEGDAILVCTGANSLKAKNTKRDARVGLSVVAADNPYNSMTKFFVLDVL